MFAVLQFPSWFRSRRSGRIPFAYVLVDAQKAAEVSDSFLVKCLVQCFSGAHHAFNTGFPTPGPGGSLITLRTSTEAVMVADWDQHVRTFNLKGYNGRVPCAACKTVFGKCEYFDGDDYLLHLWDPAYEKRDFHTPASYAQLATTIKREAETGTQASLGRLETNVGVKWDPAGILRDPGARRVLQSPMCQYPDWMHCLCASGGLAQYQINGLALHFEACGIQPGDIDDWVSTVKRPKGMTPVPRTVSPPALSAEKMRTCVHSRLKY